ncbi:50S ribosomal protein L19 [Candidatus Parcubacteria bacterium]|nr:50S ribosomal protein L19 [Candidatus Parcubacteria bacterium]
MAIITAIIKPNLKQNLPDIRPGDTVRVQQIIKDKDKEKIQIFEGLVLARKHGKGINATITVRKVMSGVGVEKVFPIHTPMIKGIEIVKRGKVRRAKLYYLREAKGRKARLKRKEIKETEKTKSEEVGEKPKKELVKEVEEVKTEEIKQPEEKTETAEVVEKLEEKKEEKK